MTAQPDTPGPDTGSYEVIHLGGQAAVGGHRPDDAHTAVYLVLVGLGTGERRGFRAICRSR
jgi:hypothetical protein